MRKFLSKSYSGLPSLIILTILLSSNIAHAHQGPFSHATINHSVLHFLLHTLMYITLGTIVFFISRWLLKRNAEKPALKIKVKNK